MKALGAIKSAIEILNDGIGSCVFNQAPIDDLISIYAEISTLLSQFRGNLVINYINVSIILRIISDLLEH